MAISSQPICARVFLVNMWKLHMQKRTDSSFRIPEPPVGRHKHQDVVHEAHVEMAGLRHPLARANFCFWLQADLKPPEIDFRLSPSFGHSEVHSGLP